MTDQFELNEGSIKKHSDTVTFEIPKAKTNIVADEQLEELKRDSTLFLTCREYFVDESSVRIDYNIDNGFKSLTNYVTSNREFKCKIARNILAVDDLFGTQYTTLLHPDNIYANKDGQIKFAHRGIRSVLPPEEYTSSQLLQDLKNVFLYLFTPANVATQTGDEDIVKHIQMATSINQLSKVLDSVPSNNQPNLTAQPAEKKNPNSQKVVKSTTTRKKPDKRSLIIVAAVGLLLGVLLVYFVKVVPSTTAASLTVTELNQQQDENEVLQKQLENKETIVKGYQSAISGKTEEAIATFESVDSLEENAENVLVEQYMKLNTLESLSKVLDLNKSYDVKVVEKLVELDSKEANEKILGIKSDKPEVTIEQAWLNKDYKQVLEIYKTIADNKRAKLLAAKSFIETDKPKEALKLAKELKNKDLQLKSLQKEKELTEADDSLTNDKKESIVKNIDKAIKELKK